MREPITDRPLLPLRKRRFSPLTLRILAVNALALLMLMGGLLYLGQYQDRLIQSELDAMRTEAYLIAGALGEGAVVMMAGNRDELSPELSRQILRRLGEAAESRTRLFAMDGHLIADSRRFIGPSGAIQSKPLDDQVSENMILRPFIWIYEQLFINLPTRQLPNYRDGVIREARQFREARLALEGEESKVVRRGDDGLVLSVAVPVARYKEVLGALHLTRDNQKIDQAVRTVRFDILKIFGFTLVFTTLLSWYLARSIARPLLRLARAVEGLRQEGQDGRSHMQADIPDYSHRHDEVGDLSAALRAMASALKARIAAIEHFAADVAHEIKNPLTSLRSAVETASKVRDPAQLEKLLAIIVDDVRRLDRLISDISNASRLDAELARAEQAPVDLAEMLETIVGLYQSRDGALSGRFALDIKAPHAKISGIAGRLTQVLQNIIDNALSFSPKDGVVTITLSASSPQTAKITIADQGPGIPENKLAAIFDRFYSERPSGEKFGLHSGLGLSIAKQIVDAHRGVIRAENQKDAAGKIIGAIFTIELPLVR